MPIYSGSSKIKEIWVGNSKIKEVWAGSSLVWRSALPVFDPSNIALNDLLWGMAYEENKTTIVGMCSREVRNYMQTTSINYTFTSIENDYNNIPELDDIQNFYTWYCKTTKPTIEITLKSGEQLGYMCYGTTASFKVNNVTTHGNVGRVAVSSNNKYQIVQQSNFAGAGSIVFFRIRSEVSYTKFQIGVGVSSTGVTASLSQGVSNGVLASETPINYHMNLNFYIVCCSSSTPSLRLTSESGTLFRQNANGIIAKNFTKPLVPSICFGSNSSTVFYVGLQAKNIEV